MLGIYPQWSTLVQTISEPQSKKRQHFAKLQEAARKDVERAFGVLQARWAIVKGPARFWRQEDLHTIMMACVILHNLIVEDERDMEHVDFDFDCSSEVLEVFRGECTFSEYLGRSSSIRDKKQHFRLRDDIVEHLWQLRGDEN